MLRLQRPLLWLAVAFALGIALAAWLAPSSLVTAALLVLALACAGAAWRQGWDEAGTVCLLVATLAAGALRWSWAEAAARGTVGSWQGHRVALTGRVVDVAAGDGWRSYDIAVQSAAYLDVRLERPTAAAGLVRVSQTNPDGLALLPGQQGRFNGRLNGLTLRPGQAPSADGSARLIQRGIHFTLHTTSAPVLLGTTAGVAALAAATHRQLAAAVTQVLPGVQGELVEAMLLGDGASLPAGLRQDFQRTGLAHFLAVDGAKVGAVLAAAIWVLRRLGWQPRRASLAASPLLVAYCLLAGAGPAAVRATVMAGVGLVAFAFYRRADAPSALALAALALLVADPHALLQLGFQLSFAATTGILLLYRPLAHPLRRWPQWLAEPLALTIAVELAIEPLGLHAFGGLPWLSPLVHLWAMPLLAVLVPLSGAMALSAAVWVPMGRLLAYPVDWLVSVLRTGARWFAGIPVGYWEPGNLPVWGAVLWYVCLLAGGLLLRRRWTRLKLAAQQDRQARLW